MVESSSGGRDGLRKIRVMKNRDISLLMENDHDAEELLEKYALAKLFRGPNSCSVVDFGGWRELYDVVHLSPESIVATNARNIQEQRSLEPGVVCRVVQLHDDKQSGSEIKPKLPLGKRTKAAREAVDRKKLYDLSKVVALVKNNAGAKFDETVEVVMNLGVDPRHADQIVRGVVALPNGAGRDVRVAVFARDAKADEAKAAGADIVGAEDLVEEVQKGNIDFDRCIATPDMMPLVGRLGKVLGPRNLMPNPKVGTVTPDVKSAVEAAKAGSVEFRVEKAGILHVDVGKASFDEAKLVENIKAFADAVLEAKPAGAKDRFIQRVAVTSAMGSDVYVDPVCALDRNAVLSDDAIVGNVLEVPFCLFVTPTS